MSKTVNTIVEIKATCDRCGMVEISTSVVGARQPPQKMKWFRVNLKLPPGFGDPLGLDDFDGDLCQDCAQNFHDWMKLPKGER